MTFVDQGVEPAEGIRTDQFTIRPIRTDDAALDYDAVMESREFLRRWNQSTWPEDDFTVEDNTGDMQDMQTRHDAGYAFGYTVMNPDESQCLGCIYVFAPDAKWLAPAEATPVTDGDAWSSVDAVIMFWVRASHLAEGLDRTLLEVIRPWFAHEWSFGRHVYAVAESFHEQVAMLDATGLELAFRFRLPDHPADYLAYE